MDIKVNQRFGDRRPVGRLEYWRDGAWQDLSERLLFPVKVMRRLRAAGTAELLLDNSDGMLARRNLASPYNFDVSSKYDPLLDENRKIRLSQGWEAHPNILLGRSYVCSPAPVASYADPGGEKLTDGEFAETASLGDGAWTTWQPAGALVIITCTLTSPAKVKGAAVSALSRTTANVYLPNSAAAFLHTATETLGPYPMRSSHLGDDPSGRGRRLFGVDWEVNSVNAISFHLHVQSGGMVAIDEIAAYDASTTSAWYRTTFTGLLGDDISYSSAARGTVRLGQVRDTTKRLADCYVETFRHYKNQTVEQIIGDILVNSYYGLELSPEEFQLDTTSFSLPKWTEQNATALDGCGQLAQMVGYVFEADENGKYILRDLDWEAQSGEESYLPEQDLIGWEPAVSGLALRNKITIRSRDAQQKDIAVTVAEEDSIAHYGARLFTLYEPTMRTAPLARQLARAILRDYAWVQTAGAGEVAADVFLRPGDIVTVVESAAAYSRADQLYRIEAITAQQTGQRFGDYTMAIELTGYRPRVPNAVGSFTARPLEGGVELMWTDLEDAQVSYYATYQADASSGPYAQVGSAAHSPTIIASLTDGQQYWFEVAALTHDGRRGDLAGPLCCTPTSGGIPATEDDLYRPQSLTATRGGKFDRPELRWYPGMLGGEQGALFNVYRAVGSPTGSWRNVATRQKGTAESLFWRDNETLPEGTIYYRVTYWRKTGFESTPSSYAGVDSL